jgi:hypothetical protein
VAGLVPLVATLPFRYSSGTLGTFGLTPEPVVFEWPLESALILAMSRIRSFSRWLSLFPPVSLLMPLLMFSRLNGPLDSVADVGVV